MEENQAPASMIGSDLEYDDDLELPDSLVINESAHHVDGTAIGQIAFNAIYEPPSKEKVMLFLKGQPLKALITHYEHNHTTHLLNPYLYTIHVMHGDFKWVIKKRYKHFLELHQQLLLFKTSLKIPFPSKTHKKRRESFKADDKANAKRNNVLPRFPNKPEMFIGVEHIDMRIKQLEEYLNNILSLSIYRYHQATCDFIEISHLSFVYELGVKGKEGLVKKRSGSTHPGQSGCNCLGCLAGSCCLKLKHLCNDILCASWRSRWFFIKDSCFGYINPKTRHISGVVLFDQGFEVASGMYNSGLQKAFQIQTLARQIVVKCKTRSQRKLWIDALKDVASNQAKDFTQLNQHHSFAPFRANSIAQWFVDGAGYMNAVADAIEHAKHEVFIADWWLSPEIYLKRPAIDGEHWRLDKLLLRKAELGVRIFVLLYKEFEMALGLNSYYSKQTLSSLHENIKVLRHPDHAKAGVFFWAHHEKIVVVDQLFAFVGGVDLCYGRWDDYQHRLIDLGSISPSGGNLSNLRKKTSSVPGGESFYPLPLPPHYDEQLPEIVEMAPQQENGDVVNEQPLPKLQPGQSLIIPDRLDEHLKMNTPEMERKNPLINITKNVKMKGIELLNMVYMQGEDVVDDAHRNDGKVVVKRDARNVDDMRNLVEDVDGAKYWIGKDYCNFIVKDFMNLELPFVDFIDRVTTPRMPWHDIAASVEGAAARDVARHFIQRWNATKLDKARLNTAYPYLLPKSYNTLEDVNAKYSFNKQRVSCQVLRSGSTWSCGFLEPDTVEQSIHEAYVDLINRAQHFIYIENQFFISMPQSNTSTRNLIAETLYKRILRAHKENLVFRVYVVMPLLPGFEGEVGGPSGTSLHAITHWNYASISRGKDALVNRLKAAGIVNPSDYITFYGLRTHSMLNGEPISELIYVHSKLMIVDDRMVICGSANINDRSLIGKRDSEIAVLIEDEEFDDGLMNGAHYPCGKFAGSLRKQLFREHLGLMGREFERPDIDIRDPVDERFYKNVWLAIAALNTEMYDKVFHCIPTDNVKTFKELKDYALKEPLYKQELSRSMQMLNTIEGHLVLLPLEFLCNENLTPASSTVEGMMPTSLWT